MSGDTNPVEALDRRMRGGDATALAELFSHFQPQLRRMVDLRLDARLGGRVSPSDVLQEAYLDALKRLEHFTHQPDMPAYVWLRLIAGQRLVDVHRQHLGAQMRDAGQEISINRDGTAGASSMCLAAQLVGHLPSPSQAAARRELTEKLEAALNTLDPIDREVLSLRHFEELSNRETAAVLGIEPAAASKRYIRALDRLKTVVAEVPGLLDAAP